MRRLIIGLSGASGAIYGIRALEALNDVPDIVNHTVGKALDQFEIPHTLLKRWKEPPAASEAPQRAVA